MVSNNLQPILIKLVSREEMKNLVRIKNIQPDRESILKRFHMEDTIHLSQQAQTDEAYDCPIVGIHDDEFVTLAHLETEHAFKNPEEASAIQQGLTRDIQWLQALGKTVNALITGGRAWKDYCTELYSRILREDLVEILKKANVQNICQIWGRKNAKVDGPMAALFDAKEQCWYLSAYQTGNAKDVLTHADMEETFEQIHIPARFKLITRDDPSAPNAGPTRKPLLA